MKKLQFYIVFALSVVSAVLGGSVHPSKSDKLIICVVDGRGSYKKSVKFCPILERKSNIECVVGVDRLDCVRRIHKGTAHFGVFSAEDLVAARWASTEILVTNEMRFHDTNFEYEIVTVVNNEADIHSAHDLKGSKLCHPGLGLEGHWSEVLGNYLENVMVQKTCDENISIVEDRFRSASKFFGPSCKAGPWVPDPNQDRILKSKYYSLCQMCYDPYRCAIGDKHWGRRGALYCLTSGEGEVSWARLDDVRSHFGFSGLKAEANPDDYSFLCPDGHLQPLNSTQPCVWVSKPWPAIAARRSHAAYIQDLVMKLSHDDPNSWDNALLSLLESYHVKIQPLDNTIPIDDYLDQAVGFQSAYSFPECNPPRSIVFCTTSIIQHNKCSWLQEAAQVHGIVPNIQCIRGDDLDHCMDDTMYKTSDIVLVDQDLRIKAQRDYKLEPLLFEYSKEMHNRYVTVAITHKDKTISTFDDIYNSKVCLPSYEGAAFISVVQAIKDLSARKYVSLRGYFSQKSCLWQPNGHGTCKDEYRGDLGALRCLVEGKGDIAFISSDVFKNFTVGALNYQWAKLSNYKDYRLYCPYGKNDKHSKFEYCHLHWTSRGHIMVHNASLTRKNEIHNTLRDMDRLFGKDFKAHTLPFTMFGPFDKKKNVIFHDNTENLKNVRDLLKDNAPRFMENGYTKYSLEPKASEVSSSNRNYPTLIFSILFLYIILF